MANTVCPSCGGESPNGFKFCGHCGAKFNAEASAQTAVATVAPPPETEPAPPEPVSIEPAPQRDERRQVTVLFADVSGFTNMSHRMDPEQVHETMNAVFAGLGRCIEAEGGHIDKYIGDNVMALFGAPVAHEDDPARACRAAIAMQDFLADFSRGLEQRLGIGLKMRIGVNDGPVVAGGVGSEVKMQYTVMGDAVNVASRLESSAEPGSTLVSASVRRQARRVCAFDAVRHLTVKGKPEPIEAYEIAHGRVQAEADYQNEAAPLIGRDVELRDLIDALASDMKWIDLRGPVGVGRCRLAHEAARAAGARLLPVTLSERAAKRPLGLIRLIVQALLIDATPQTAFDNEETFGAALKTLGEDLSPYRSALWSLWLGAARSDNETSDPQALRGMIDLGVRLLFSVSRDLDPSTACLIRGWEHADEASLEWLADLRDQPGGLPIRLIVAVEPAGEQQTA
ncbi:MAG: adenylate/guanylate cyclase domain-containing protein, partial [Planctomycetota bacterium]